MKRNSITENLSKKVIQKMKTLKYYRHKDLHLLPFRIRTSGKSLKNTPYYAACYLFCILGFFFLAIIGNPSWSSMEGFESFIFVFLFLKATKKAREAK